MTIFEYLSVFISIVIGLGVVRVLGGVAAIIDRQDARSDWVHSAWVGYFVFYLPYFWWFTFDWRRAEVWTFPVFIFVVFFAMLAYLTVVVLVPTRDSDVADRKAYFDRVRPRFFSLFALLMTTDVVDTILKPGNLDDVGSSYGPIMGIMILGNVAAAITERRLFHQIWVVVTILLTLTFGLGVWADIFPVSNI